MRIFEYEMKNVNDMKKIRNLLMTLFWGGIVVAVLLAVLFELTKLRVDEGCRRPLSEAGCRR